ncbi:MAG: hypothetical protein EAZ42_11515 [Verrucomicrobia bacterium]|nr:MAG: hypothetical protein EAZ42_11515 [Verrucomicrobiota bacterium]
MHLIHRLPPLNNFKSMACAFLLFQASANGQGMVVINEIHYNSVDNTSPEEFIELHNPGNQALDLSGYKLTDAIEFTFPAGVNLPAGGYVVVAENPARLQSLFGISGVRGPWTGRLSSKGERIDLLDASGVRRDRVDYGVGFPWPTGSDGAGSSASLVNPSLDNDLGGSWRALGAPTPMEINRPYRPAHLIAPQIRQVSHFPTTPAPGQEVVIAAKVTDPDGVGEVWLNHQSVAPGSYIRLTDINYQSTWTSTRMVDDGTSGDAVANDSVYSAVLPSSLQEHRHLIRYRILCSDSIGNEQLVPYFDDEQPNFAYFVYGQTPAWRGAMRPTSFDVFPSTQWITFPREIIDSISPLHLIARSQDVSFSQYNSSYSDTKFYGTVVHRGVVYDHIQFKVRGVGSTYVSGKNKWNLFFNRSRDFQAYDNNGNPYREKWNNLLVNANSSPWVAMNRGSGGVEEAVSHRIFQIAGNPAMHTQFMHYRVIDAAEEADPANQYNGDLWGLYLGLEPTEGNFLDERGLPDGNIYSIEDGFGDKKNQGATHVSNNSDWNSFRSLSKAGGQTESWYRANVDLPALYTFLALSRLIGNVDVRLGDNYRFYRRPTDNRWVIIPYDMDMQFIAAHHWGGRIDGVVAAGVPEIFAAISRHPQIAREYRNRCRDVLSLMASDATANGGQVGQLFDEYRRMINPTGLIPSWAHLDAYLWNLNPRTRGFAGGQGQSNHKGNFFRSYYVDGSRGGLGDTVRTDSWIRTLPDPSNQGFAEHVDLIQWFVNYATNTWPGGPWTRKAIFAAGSGQDDSLDRQRGYGFKYLEFESQYGGWSDSRFQPTYPAWTDEPVKPQIGYEGPAMHPSDQLRFRSSEFTDPQGASTVAAHEWRIARIAAPGLAGYTAGRPYRYEMETVWSSGLLTSPPGEFIFPQGIAEPGMTYRVRVRHSDQTGNWSLWSEPYQFVATPPAPMDMVHYWNFNSSSDYLIPTRTTTSPASLQVTGAHQSDDGRGFAGLNAREGDAAGRHLRINSPATAGTQLQMALPTVGYEQIVIKYEARRTANGAGAQQIDYTLDGTTYQSFRLLTLFDSDPIIYTLDFRSVIGVANNPNFALRVTFPQAAGGNQGNQRIDNLTVEGVRLGMTYANWQLLAFPDPADRANLQVAGPLADPTQSGISNLTRYALGIFPNSSAAEHLLRVVNREGNFFLRLKVMADRRDLRWLVQKSPDLSSWSSAYDPTSDGPLAVDPQGWSEIPIISTIPQYFYRLSFQLRAE